MIQQKSKPTLVNIVQDYFEKILSDVQGLKCLVLDEETTGIISLISSQSQILKKDVYLIEKIDKKSNEKLKHLKAIYFVRPTQQNYAIIRNEIKENRFLSYYLYFTNTVEDIEIEKLAELDENDLIKSIQEIFADFYVINNDLFSLEIPSSIGLSRIQQSWNSNDMENYKRIYQGLFSLCLALRKNPQIRYLTSSDICQKLAVSLQSGLQNEEKNNQSQFDRDSRCLLLITDRKEDPVTPLLNQWTYQAMLHELMGLDKNIVNLEKTDQKYKGSKTEEKEFVVAAYQDSFFENNIYSNFGELAQNMKDFIDQMSSQRQQSIKIESLEDMQRALDDYPELKRMSGNVQKHVTLTSEISKLVEQRHLMDVSRVEQELTAKEAKNDHYRQIVEILQNKQIQGFEKLKLVILFVLRYEGEVYDKIEKLKEMLRDSGVSQNSINLINYTLEYAGKQKRSGDLFSDKDLFNKTKNIFQQVFKDVPNVYTQHQPYLLTLLDQISKNKLKESEYPIAGSRFADKPNEIIIFQIGGTTFEEAKEIGIKNKQSLNQMNIILGGTTVHNTKSFLAEISQINLDRNQDVAITIDQGFGGNKKGFYQMN